MDEVDFIVAAWQRERPDADLSPMQIWSRLTRLSKLLDRVRKASFAAHDLEPWEWDVLAALRRAGEPYEMSPGQLVDATLVTSGTMTNRVDRLAERGLVDRRPAVSDRRGIVVRLTKQGRRIADAALDTLMAHEAELLHQLPEVDRRPLVEALRMLGAKLSN
jgi:DNA-binding MarR family transcriptional regulator